MRVSLRAPLRVPLRAPLRVPMTGFWLSSPIARPEKSSNFLRKTRYIKPQSLKFSDWLSKLGRVPLRAPLRFPSGVALRVPLRVPLNVSFMGSFMGSFKGSCKGSFKGPFKGPFKGTFKASFEGSLKRPFKGSTMDLGLFYGAVSSYFLLIPSFNPEVRKQKR